VAMQMRTWLPTGGTLDAPAWRRRHVVVVTTLTLSAVGLLPLAVAERTPLWHAALHMAPCLGLALLAGWSRLSRRIRALAASVGLVLACIGLLDVAAGAPEAHFTFFVAVVLLSLYQDWMSFGVAVLLVLGDHGLRVLGDAAVHGGAHAAVSLQWALVHAGFVLAASAASVTGWAFTEDDHRALTRRILALEEQRRAELAQRALHDPLTGLPNRTLVLERLHQALARRHEPGTDAGVLFLDVDNLKEVNDTWGHLVGDALLVELADRLRQYSREEDTAGRLSGDEFMIVCGRLEGLPDLLGVQERVRQALNVPVVAAGVPLQLSVSVGGALAQGEDAATVVARADANMYARKHPAKAGGRSPATTQV
jgi:diguanylate cyclase (GGDEF)-like protein